jgi:hypothetical protein
MKTICSICKHSLEHHDDFGAGACHRDYCTCKGEGLRGNPGMIEALVKSGRLSGRGC